MSNRVAHRGPGRDRRSFWIAVGLMTATTAWLPACGGGGGGGDGGGSQPPPAVVTGSSFAPTSGPGDTEKYFPKATGNEWYFRYETEESGFPPMDGLMSVAVTGTKSVLGVEAIVLAQDDLEQGIGDVENYYGVSPGGITFVGNDDSQDDITPKLVPWVQLLFPVELGRISTLTATNLRVGTDNAGNVLTLDLTQRIDNEAFEALNVPAGSFPRALKQVTTLSGTVRNTKLNQSISLTGGEIRWVVPGVGVVRQAMQAQVDTESTSSIADLRGYVVDGVPHGIGLPVDLLDDLSPVSGDPNPPIGQPAMASDGTNFLVVARRATGVAPTYDAQWFASVVRSDGTVIGSTALEPPRPVFDPAAAQRAAVAFDGNNYLVVFERDNNFASSGEHASLVAARVSPQGVLLEPATQVAGPGSNSPALAFDGARYLLVYSASISYENYGQLQAQFVSPATGQASGAPFQVTPAPGYQSHPAVAYGGTHYLAVWDQTDFNGQPPGVIGARIDPAGSVLDVNGFPIHAATACCLGYRPAVTFGGGNFLVVWQDYRQLNDNLHTNIYAMRVTPAAQLLDGPSANGGIPVTTVAGVAEVSPQVVFFDDHYVAAWVKAPSPGVYEGLHGARLSTAGTVVSPGASGMLLTSGGYELYPTMATSPTVAMLAWFSPRASGDANAVGGVALHPFGP